MIRVELIAELWRLHFVEKVNISKLARRFHLSRPTVRKHLQTEGDPVYPTRKKQPYPQLGPYLDRLGAWLEFDPGTRTLPEFSTRFSCLTAVSWFNDPVQRV